MASSRPCTWADIDPADREWVDPAMVDAMIERGLVPPLPDENRAGTAGEPGRG